MNSSGQLTLEDIFTETKPSPSEIKPEKPIKKVYSPRELYEMGKNPTKQEIDLWEAEVWKLLRQERLSSGNYDLNWFSACDLYRKRRDEL